MNRVDLRRFEFDFDTTWAAFFTDEKLKVYSRYGGRDEGQPEDRMTKESLLQTMRDVLKAHERRAEKRIDGLSVTQPAADTFPTPEEIPLLSASHEGCVHCHQVREYRLLQRFHDGKFTRKNVFPYPLPDNIGISVDRKHGHRIQEIEGMSAAAKVGLAADDIIVGVNDVPTRSEFDIRWAFHHASDNRPLSITVRRKGAGKQTSVVKVDLKVPENWRQTDISWRKSMRSIPFPFAMRGYALTRSQREELGFKRDDLAIKIISVKGNGLATNLKLRKTDIVVGIGSHPSDHLTFAEFRSELLRRFKPGDKVKLLVRRKDKRVEVSGTFPNWFTAENAVP